MGYTYDQLRQATNGGGGFRPPRSRENAVNLRKQLNAAAQSLEQNGNAALAEKLKEYAQAIRNVSAKDAFTPQKKAATAEALKKVNGLGDFLAEKDPSGASNYALIAGELKNSPEGNFGENVEFISGTLDLDIEVDALEAGRKQYEATRSAAPKQPPIPQPQPAPRQQPPAAKQPAPKQQPPARQAVPKPQIKADKPLAEPKAPVFDPNPPASKGVANMDELKNSGIEQPQGLDVLDDLEAQTASYQEIGVPENASMADAYRAWAPETPIQMAVDEHGRVYDDEETIVSALEKPGKRLFVFEEDGEAPHALENRGGRLFASESRISAENQAEEYREDKQYSPKRSLDARDIAELPDKNTINVVSRTAKQYSKEIKKVKEAIDELDTDYKEAKKWVDGLRASKKPKSPSTGAAIKRIGLKIITLGFGETEEYKDYKRRVKNWESEDRMHQRNLKELPEKRKGQKEKLDNLQQEGSKYFRYETKLRQEYNPAQRKRMVEDYRQRTEVRMAGVADIIKTGKVTEHNIFANTWLAKANCEGKKYDEPGALESLKSYVVSRTVEEKMLEHTIQDRDGSRPINAALAEQLNDGSLMQRMERDGIFNKMLQEQGDKPIDAEEFYHEYRKRSAEREAERDHPLNRLQQQRKSMIEAFGEKPVTKDCLTDIARLKVLDQAIEQAKELPKDPAQVTKDQKAKFLQAQADINRPEKLKPFMNPEREAALAKMEQNLNKATKAMDEDYLATKKSEHGMYRDVEQIVYGGFGVFSLDKMSDMLDDMVELQKESAPEPDKKQEEPQLGGSAV